MSVIMGRVIRVIMPMMAIITAVRWLMSAIMDLIAAAITTTITITMTPPLAAPSPIMARPTMAVVLSPA